MPPEASTLAGDVDSIFYYIVYAAIIIFCIVLFLMLYFAIRYRHTKQAEEATTPAITQNITLELLWSIIPTILVMICFFWGFHVFMKMNVVPKDAMEIKVTGQKWFWSFDYPEGVSTVNELVVPDNKPIKLLMSSRDVIHSFFVPDFRTKMDVLPNRYSVTWFEAKEPGEHNLFCAEFCGDGHSKMIGKVKVVSQREYEAWLEEGSAGGEGIPPEKLGEQLFKSKACVTCHSTEGIRITGPPLNGAFGNPVVLKRGATITMDENYIRKSILEPQADVVAGYDPVMPTYQGLLKDKQIDALIAYIKSLK